MGENNPLLLLLIMKSFNSRSSHGYHGSKRRELTQLTTHTHVDRTHSLTHVLTSTQLQPRDAKRQLSYYMSVPARFFRVSVIHRTL